MIKEAERYVQRGQIAELRFWVEALRRGVVVSRPHHGARYDFIVDCGSRLWRVQVKSTGVKVQRTYRVNAFGTSVRNRYSRREVDFIAAYVTPRKEWYIIPLRAVKSTAAVLSPTGRLGRYREAWHLLLDRSKDARIHIEAAADTANPAINAEVLAEIEKLYKG
jgi:hypothetical protein